MTTTIRTVQIGTAALKGTRGASHAVWFSATQLIRGTHVNNCSVMSGDFEEALMRSDTPTVYWIALTSGIPATCVMIRSVWPSTPRRMQQESQLLL